jgi:hypothetical protein
MLGFYPNGAVPNGDGGSVAPIAGGGGLATVSGVSVNPASVTMAGNATQQFTPTVTGTGAFSTAVTWSASAGQVSSGLFTAPAATSSAQTITVTATSVADPTKFGTATVTIAAAQPSQTGGTGTITVPASRTAVFAGRQRVAVFSTPSPVTLAKGAQDELFIVGDFTKDLTDAATTAISVAPVSDGVAVLVAPQLQGMLGVVKLGAFDPNVVAPSFTFRLTLENGEQIDRTIKFTVLDDRTHVFGKDPDDKRYWAFNLAADAARGTTSLASVQAPVVAGVTSLATPTINGNTAIVKLGGLDVAGGANSCSLTALLANGEKLVNTIYFNREDH